MTEYTAKRVILKDTQGNYLIPYVGNTGGAIVGSTFFSPTPINDANVHLLDGGVVGKTGIYEEFYNKFITPLKTSNPELFVTDTVHAQEIAQHKVTNKFVDNVDNIRLPKFGEYNFTVNEQIGVQGNGKTLGMTDGTQDVGTGVSLINNDKKFLLRPEQLNKPVGSKPEGDTIYNKTVGISTNPNNSNIKANLQSNLKGYWYIVVSSTSKTDIQTNLDNVTADLNNKADRDLLNTPDNVDVVVEHKVNSDGSWYRKYKSGWLEQGGVSKITETDVFNPVNLTKPFKDSNYTLTLISEVDANHGLIASIAQITTTSFAFVLSYKPSTSTKILGTRWYACGQGV